MAGSAQKEAASAARADARRRRLKAIRKMRPSNLDGRFPREIKRGGDLPTSLILVVALLTLAFVLLVQALPVLVER